jgi:hypothetical protein
MQQLYTPYWIVERLFTSNSLLFSQKKRKKKKGGRKKGGKGEGKK